MLNTSFVLLSLLVQAAGNPVVVRVTDHVLVPGVQRFGVNISAPDSYGANQILKNIIPNPGFEDGVYGMVFHADEGATGRKVPQAFWDPNWNNNEAQVGQPAGFWDGADYEIVYGPAKGRHGKIERFVIEGGRSVFYLDSDGAAPQKWDVLFVRRSGPGLNKAEGADPSAVRPGSPGKQSLRLKAPGDWKPAYAHYADSLWRDGDTSAGKLFLVRGQWHLEFWAKGKRAGEQLVAVFKREGEAEFLNKTFDLSVDWKKYEATCDVPESADRLKHYAPDAHHPILMFAFYLPQSDAEAWVDDLALCRSAQNPTVFTDTLVDRLKELRPGALRFWAEQFGDTLANQLAEPFARGPYGYKPHCRTAWAWGYGLHDFLALCRETGAEPWYVIPPTFSPDDLANLAAYLGASADAHPYGKKRTDLGQAEPWTSVFKSIHLEYGNEMWGAASGGDPFMGASALGGERLGAIANDRLQLLRAAPYFDKGKINLIIGGQTFVPAAQRAILGQCEPIPCVALGPYFGILDRFASDPEVYGPLLAGPIYQAAHGDMAKNWGILRDSGRQARMAVYEINFHTTDGPAPADLRNKFVAGAAGALALPLSMLVYQRDFAAAPQCAFTACQYSFHCKDQHVRLWGLLRDLESTGRKRPTWLGLELVNKAIAGDAVETVQEGALPTWNQPPLNGVGEEITVACLQTFAFREGKRNGLVLFNLSLDKALDVRIEPLSPPTNEAKHEWISPQKLADTNEDAETVIIESAEIADFSNGFEMTLPPHSVHTLTWQDAG